MQITKDWKKYIEDHFDESKKSALKTTLEVERSPLKYQLPGADGPVSYWTRTLHIPKFFSQEDKKNFESIVSTSYGIFEKTIDAYKKDPKIRALFGFSPMMEKLILRDPGYQTRIPVMRVDIFYNEDTKDFQFCEFNTDGSSAMFENDTMKDLMKYNNVWNELKPDVEYMELTDPWVDGLISVYRQTKDAKDNPSILITDFLEKAYLPELYAFEKAFRKKGWDCEVEDIRNLEYDGSHLIHAKTGKVYDVVYRRAVTSDIERNADLVQPFLKAVENNDVVLIGDFQTQIIHSKMINKALTHPDLQKYFTEEEKQFIANHLPQTFDLTRDVIPMLEEDKDRWIIKPQDSYGAKGVWAGVDVSAKMWKKLVEDFADTDYIVQTYVPHFKTENIDLVNHDEFMNYSNMTGLYVYDGKFAGAYSRLSDAGIISSQYNEKMVPTFFVKNQSDDQ